MDKRVEAAQGDGRERSLPDDLSSLFPEPVFLEGEDPQKYRRLREAFVKERNPQSVFDWMELHNDVTALWEKMRFENLQSAIISAGRIQAVTELAVEVNLASPGLRKNRNGELTRGYFSPDARTRKKAQAEFEEVGVSEMVVNATAAQLKSEPLRMFEDMIRSRASQCRKIIRKARPPRTKPTVKLVGGTDFNGN